MSGYFQRLVSSARAPSAAIRPVLGSLFSASTHESTAESLPRVEEMAISHQTEFRGTIAPQPPRADQIAPEPRPARRDILHVETQSKASQAAVDGSAPENFQVEEEIAASGQPGSSRPISEARTPFTPLVIEDSRGTRPALETSVKGGPREKPFEGAELPLERPDQQVIRRGPYRPLVAEGLRPKDARVFQNPNPLTPDGRRIERIDWPRATARAEREADEIQIHIGRIEVTAVPPPPARPAAQPVRKSLRLDEYLRRGRERAL